MANQFLPFATGVAANVLTPAEYAALTSIVSDGFQSGILASKRLNTVLRQSAFVAAAMGQIVSDSGVNAVDDGDLTTFKTNFLAAMAPNGFTGSNQSLAASGYQRLPGGLIIQWGIVQSANVMTTTVNYPIAFPNNCFQVVASGYNISGGIQALVTVNSPSGLSYALFNAFYANSGVAMSLAGTSQVRIQYIAIGN